MNDLMKALECCAEYFCGECPYQKYNSYEYKLRCIHILVIDLANADLKPERHGRWEWKDFHGDGTLSLCCSECLETEGAREGFEYCPNCGVKMEVE